jgi:phage terminase Nu1 subunit (DNA packaging protein)
MFVDYWIAQPGQKGVKTDWDATWRNWMRRKQADLKAGRKPKDQQVIDILEQGRQMQAMEDRRAIG